MWRAGSNLLANRSPHCVRDDTPEHVIANSERVKQSVCKQDLYLDYFATLVMTKNKMATRLKASRHDNPTLAPRFLSLRWSEKIFPRSLNVSLPRSTFVACWKQSACQQIAASSYKTPRHDKLFFRDTRLLGFTETHFARFLSLRAVLKSRRGNLIASYLHFIASSICFWITSSHS